MGAASELGTGLISPCPLQVANLAVQGMSETLATEAGAKVYTFGSYRLGVHGAGADIDTLCVCPRHIEQKHFFGKLKDMLKSNPEVTELTACGAAAVSSVRIVFLILHVCVCTEQDVPDAFVPVIKMIFGGVEVRDITYVRIVDAVTDGFVVCTPGIGNDSG